jgi:hypothetical protein
MPYISYQNAYGQQKINRLLRKLYAPRPKWTDIVLRRRQALRHPQQQHEEDDSCREDSGSSDVDSDDDDEDEEDEDLGESPKTESQIFERHMKRVIRAYVDYTHQGVKLPLHPRRQVHAYSEISHICRLTLVELWTNHTITCSRILRIGIEVKSFLSGKSLPEIRIIIFLWCK